MYKLLIPEQFHIEHKKAFEYFRKTGKGKVIGKNIELKAIKKDGSIFPVELLLAANKIDGKWGSIGIIRDISESEHARQKLFESERGMERCVLNDEL